MNDALHIAVFYDAAQALWPQCASLLAEDALDGHAILYATDEHSAQTVQQNLGHIGGAIETVESINLHLRASPMRTPPAIAAIEQRVQALLDRGARRVLLMIEMTWAIRTPAGAVRLAEFETALAALQDALPMTVCCMYNKDVMLDEQLLVGLHAHSHILAGSGPCRNPHALPAKLLGSHNPRKQVEHWLRQLSCAPDQVQPTEPSETALYSRENFAPLVTNDPSHQRWKIRCFGALRVYREEGDPVVWDASPGATSKTRTLFAYLLVRGEHGAGVEEIADLLWPDAHDSHQSLNRLYHTVHCLRNALSPGLATSRESPFLRHADQRYFLAVPPGTWIDLPMFQEQCHNVAQHEKAGRLDQAMICCESAERLYSGDLFANIPEKYAANREQDWCLSRRYWFREMYLKLMWTAASIQRRRGDLADAQAYCDKALATDPACEPAHTEKMHALAAAGREDALRRQFKTLEHALHAAGLGTPSTESVTLFQQLTQRARHPLKN